MNAPGESTGAGGRLITWRSGGWQLLLAAALILLVSGWRVLPMLRSTEGALGDGRRVESYGFDLSNLSLPHGTVAAAGLPREGIPSLDNPPSMPAAGVAPLNERRRKYLVSDDRVVGVTLGGESRAYPVRVLNWHEVVNDSLGGVPIAVTFHPLCDSAAVFDRRVGREVLEFGVSGLLYNSNLLMFDRRVDQQLPSLWSQILGRAVAGPAARSNTTLRTIPSSLARWDVWSARHPATTVLQPDPARIKRYVRNPYGNYLRTGKLRFVVDPLPPEGSLPPMARVLAIERDGERRVVPLDRMTAERLRADPWFDGLPVTVETTSDVPSVIVEGGSDARVLHTLWFAWYSHHPQTALDELRPGRAE